MKLLKKMSVVGALLVAATVSAQAQAAFVNGGFENGFDQWVATGHAYTVTMNGTIRDRQNYLDYMGWDGADVWFGNNQAGDGVTYAVFGSNGNESDGSVTSAAWTATNQFVSFKHAGNNTSFLPDYSKAFAAILDLDGNELLRVYATSYNDSVWRSFDLDLSLAGLSYGDQFMFYYEDGASWSVLDAVAQTGAQLTGAPAPVEAPLGFAALGLGLIGLASRRKA